MFNEAGLSVKTRKGVRKTACSLRGLTVSMFRETKAPVGVKKKVTRNTKQIKVQPPYPRCLRSPSHSVHTGHNGKVSQRQLFPAFQIHGNVHAC